MNKVPFVPGTSRLRRNIVSKTTSGGIPTTEQEGQASSAAADSAPASSFRHGSPADYTVAKSKLKAAGQSTRLTRCSVKLINLTLTAFEYYRSLGMLKSYRVLNRTGFVKSLKKFEKATRIPASSPFSEKLDEANFVSSTKLDELIRETEDGFAEVFERTFKVFLDLEVAATNLCNLTRW